MTNIKKALTSTNKSVFRQTHKQIVSQTSERERIEKNIPNYHFNPATPTYSIGNLRSVRLANLNNTVFFIHTYYFMRWTILASLNENTRWLEVVSTQTAAVGMDKTKKHTFDLRHKKVSHQRTNNKLVSLSFDGHNSHYYQLHHGRDERAEWETPCMKNE